MILLRRCNSCNIINRLVSTVQKTKIIRNTSDKVRRTCDQLYDLVKSEDGTVKNSDFSHGLEVRGILRDDPRVSDLIKTLRACGSTLNKEEFVNCASQSLSVVENAFTNSNIICDFPAFSENMRELYNDCLNKDGGKMADYIPQLAHQNPDHFGLSICTIDGQRMNIGDTNVEFCIQSCSKPISYCLALEEHGIDRVHKHVGREPSGIEFNALKLNALGLPHNPLINSGAIIICSLIKNMLDAADRFDHVSNVWKQLTGGTGLGYSNPVYLSERSTGDRNFALAYFMRESKAFPPEVNIIDILEFYFQCCSMMITSNHLSVVAATLANGGVCPLTEEQVFKASTVKNCLSMMYSCGMYDYSGEFAFNIGLPAKSGVAGGVFAIIPNVMGICSFSPPLDSYGNSFKGVEFFKSLMEKFNFHLFDNIEMTTTKENPRKHQDHDEITQDNIIKFASMGDLNALKRFRIKGNDLNVGDYDNRTPLHLAASNGHLNVVEYLWEKGGVKHVNDVDRWNGTPYDDAVREGHHSLADFLRSVGGRSGAAIRKNKERSDAGDNQD